MRDGLRGVIHAVVGGICLASAGCAPDADETATEPVGVSHQNLTAAPSSTSFAAFESLQVRPLALSPNGKKLFAVNTPDNRLEIFQVIDLRPRLIPLDSVSVGLEPVAVAARSDDEVWVINHLSDSVSIVKIDFLGRGRVVRTLQLGDEPRDIVFGGPGRNLAFITTAHRGQNTGDDPQLFDPTAGRADVWVFDADNLGAAPSGTRLTKLTFFADTPRALAVSADGSRVYAAPFYSGNQTTVASKEAVATVYKDKVDPANPFFFFHMGSRQPLTSRVVKYKAGPEGAFHWYDDLGTNFDAWVRVSLPDHDVFTIDATQSPPVAIASGTYAHAGTTLFNMAVNPVNGKVYIANTEAHNDVRFEGHNPTLNVTSVRGEAVDSRITVLDPASGAMVYNNLNSHVVGGVGNKQLSRTFPQDLTVSPDGSTLFVVAQGSSKLAIYPTSALENGQAAPTTQNQVTLSGGGPTGVVLDKQAKQAFVLTRFDNGISVVDVATRTERDHMKMYNPEPAPIIAGRRFLYDAAYTSDNGTQACASCHVGGDFDALAWDLGNPGGGPLPITRAGTDDALFTAPPEFLAGFVPHSADQFKAFLPVKGPMTTQSLRGLDNHGAMHWRGDRNGAVKQDGTPFTDQTGAPVISSQPDNGMFDEVEAFASFNVAFPGLIGRSTMLTNAEMGDFTSFSLQVMYPPNPIRALDNSLTPMEAAGRAFYFQTLPDGTELPVDRIHSCNGCHTLDPNGNAGLSEHPGFFGSSGKISFENLAQVFKVAHLRNAYQKVGMFASSPDSNRAFTPSPQLNPPLRAIRGYGYQPDGAVGSVEHHMTGQNFIRSLNASSPVGANPGGIPTFVLDAHGDPQPIPDAAGFAVRRQLGAFLMAYDSNYKPVVGQQVTFDASAGTAADARIALLMARANAGDCELVAKVFLLLRERGFLYQGGVFKADTCRDTALSLEQLKKLAWNDNHAITFTCVPPGSGYRIGVDRDVDGIMDADDLR